MEETRFERGLRFQNLKRTPDNQLDVKPTDAREPIDMFITEFVHGDIYSRGGLSLRDREMVTLTVYITLAQPQFIEGHIRSAFAVGITKEEVEEIIIQTIPFSGFSNAIIAMQCLKNVLKQQAEQA